jgi:site-specific DNA-cytosine methylase
MPTITSRHYKEGFRVSERHNNTFVLYKAASGDRYYSENAPTLRSLSSTSGHQAGNGAYKVREFQGEEWLERPITAIEAERLMGWEEGCTATGINDRGEEISISTTQRIKMLGNGIIPNEVTEILDALKTFL